MGDEGEWNVGQLVRERHGADAVLVGFTTSHGTVTAAADWEHPPEAKTVRPALPGSVEALFHASGLGDFEAEVPRQFGAVIHLDETTAVEPLDPFSTWRRAEAPETYPSGV